MNATTAVAVVLIVAGVLGLAYGGFSYTRQTHEAKFGPARGLGKLLWRPVLNPLVLFLQTACALPAAPASYPVVYVLQTQGVKMRLVRRKWI